MFFRVGDVVICSLLFFVVVKYNIIIITDIANTIKPILYLLSIFIYIK